MIQYDLNGDFMYEVCTPHNKPHARQHKWLNKGRQTYCAAWLHVSSLLWCRQAGNGPRACHAACCYRAAAAALCTELGVASTWAGTRRQLPRSNASVSRATLAAHRIQGSRCYWHNNTHHSSTLTTTTHSPQQHTHHIIRLTTASHSPRSPHITADMQRRQLSMTTNRSG